MKKSATLFVTAAPGRVVPIHRSTMAGVGGKQLRISEADGEVELPNDIAVRRRIAKGDLLLVKPKSKPTTTTPAKEG